MKFLTPGAFDAPTHPTHNGGKGKDKRILSLKSEVSDLPGELY